jgi:steroid delta-isomerase-like uncharacterized protein
MILDGINARRQVEGMDNHFRILIERYFQELFNQGRVELISELLHPDYINHSPGTPELPRGREGVAIVVTGLRRAFPDLRYTVDDLVIGADAVATRTTMTGTHRGDLFGVPATGRSVKVTQFTIERIADGKIIAHHRLTDDLSLLRQLGILPPG